MFNAHRRLDGEVGTRIPNGANRSFSPTFRYVNVRARNRHLNVILSKLGVAREAVECCFEASKPADLAAAAAIFTARDGLAGSTRFPESLLLLLRHRVQPPKPLNGDCLD